jgi:cytochrome c biogenesis protein CcdA
MSYTLALAAGALPTLAHCVLPLIPILAGSALLAHRLGPLALVAGLGLSYAVVGMLLASAGTIAGLGQGTLRVAGAVILIVFGILLLVPGLQTRFAGIRTRQRRTRLAGAPESPRAGRAVPGGAGAEGGLEPLRGTDLGGAVARSKAWIVKP